MRELHTNELKSDSKNGANDESEIEKIRSHDEDEQ